MTTYIEGELARVKAAEGSPYKPIIQISSDSGKTKHLSISWETLAKIEQVLLQAEREGS